MFSESNGPMVSVATVFITAATLLAVSGNTAIAQGQGGVDERLLACSAIEDMAERAACFDDAVKAMQQGGASAPAEAAATAAPAATVEPPPAEAAPQAPVAEEPVMQIEKQMDAEDVEEKFVEFTATITNSSKSGLYHFVVELDNGQVWEETDGSRRPGLPKVGQTVRVTEGRLGGYRMKIGSANKLSWVRRLK
jgi:hypothetical protein